MGIYCDDGMHRVPRTHDPLGRPTNARATGACSLARFAGSEWDTPPASRYDAITRTDS